MAETTTHPNANNERRPNIFDSLRALGRWGVGRALDAETAVAEARQRAEQAWADAQANQRVIKGPAAQDVDPDEDHTDEAWYLSDPAAKALIREVEADVGKTWEEMVDSAFGGHPPAELTTYLDGGPKLPVNIRARLVSAAERRDRAQQVDQVQS